MVLKGIYLVGVCVLFSICDSAFVNTHQKCSYKDGECVVNLAHNVLKDISKTGINEINMPPIDPLNLKDIAIPMLGLFNISLREVQVKGVKDCKINRIENNVERGESTVDVTCDINIKGKFKLDDLSPLVENFLGRNTIRADGSTKIKVDRVNMKMKFIYDVIRKQDGEIYFSCHIDKFVYNVDIENIRMVATKIYFGNQDISDVVVSFVNQNWKFLMPTFGKAIFDVVMEIFNNILHSFFTQVPAKYFLIDDLSAFVKN